MSKKKHTCDGCGVVVPIEGRFVAEVNGLFKKFSACVDTIKTLVREAERNGKRANKAAIARQLGIDRKSVYKALEL